MLTAGLLSPDNLVRAQPTSGIVTLAFDDGISNQINNGFPLMQQHGFAGTYYIITSRVGTAGYLSLSDLNTLQNAGNEIASHSVDHPAFTSISDAQINSECNASQQFLRANGFPAINFAYPYGLANSHTDSIVLQYYRSARHSYGSGYLVSIPPTPTQMSIPMGFGGETGNSTDIAIDEGIVNQAHATNSWVIIFFHNITSTAPINQYQIQQSDFSAILNYIGSSSVQVLTVNQALNLWSPYNVNILPSSAALDVGQSQTFAVSASGALSLYKYQWYLSGNAPGSTAIAVGANNSSYTFGASSVGSYALYANATNSVGTPITVKSNTASITVNSALAAPTVTPAPVMVNQGKNSSLTSSAIKTGTPPYTYQWFESAPGGSFVNVGSYSANFSFVTSSVTVAGNWSFILQVKDNLGLAANSSAVSVMVNPTVFASAGDNGVISPAGNVSVNFGGGQTFNVTANAGFNVVDVSVDGSSVGAVSSYNFTNVQASHTISATFAPSPTPTPTPTTTPSPTPTQTPSSTPLPTLAPTAMPTPYPSPIEWISSTAAPTPIPTPLPTSAPTRIIGNDTVDLAFSGNETSLQISDIAIATNKSDTSTTVFFNAIGENGTTYFSNVTVPKSAVLYGTIPTIYIDGQSAQNQGYSQDANNYYAWYMTHASTHKISIVFTPASNRIPVFQHPTASPNRVKPQSFAYVTSYIVTGALAVIAIAATLLVSKKKQGRQKLKDNSS